ncbi:MAG: plastocyanin/azurin family copper-binding protein [Myxococcales bacterium]|nr:plastocyanin/azurin family copper-binding protein [Myxococcales bacterium]MDD9972318.1 plastocyanin/azurin family copper-binding protein [Myxococcales bacterium]
MKKTWIGTFCAACLGLALAYSLTFVSIPASGQNTGSVKASVTVPEGQVENTVVRIEGVPGSNPRLKGVKQSAEMGQKELQFTPQMVAIPAGSTIDFPNHDKVFHNVFSLSRTKRFDLGLYKQGSSKSVTFNRPGVVDVYCNIHPQMVAKVLVVDTIHYGVADKQGHVQIDGVPAGTYPVVAWHPARGEARGEVTIKPGQASQVSLAITGEKQSERHLRKDGTPYGRYK